MVGIFAEQVSEVCRHAVLGRDIQLRVGRITGEDDRGSFADDELLTDHIGDGIGQRSLLDIIGAEQVHIARLGVIRQLECTTSARQDTVAVSLTQHELELQLRVHLEVQFDQTPAGAQDLLFGLGLLLLLGYVIDIIEIVLLGMISSRISSPRASSESRFVTKWMKFDS